MRPTPKLWLPHFSWPKLAILGGFALTMGVASQLPAGTTKQLLFHIALWVWPTLTWGATIAGDWEERLVLAGGATLLAHTIATLLLHYLPGPFPAVWLGVWVVGWVGWSLWRSPQPLPPMPKPTHLIALALLLLITIGLRLYNMDYKEVQGDEGVVLVRAAAALEGDDAILFLHQKGPVEILLPMAVWSLTEQITEFWARLPFTWASILSVLAWGAVGRRWFGVSVGWLTAFGLAIMGFSVAFGRIIQYQSFVLLWTALSVLAATRYAQASNRQPTTLIVSVLFMGGALLSHYDAILIAPAVAWLVWQADKKAIPWSTWLVALAVGGGVLATFYLPFMRHENFGHTLSYLLNDRVGAGSPTVSLWTKMSRVWTMVTFYNSTYYIVGLLVSLLIGLVAMRKNRISISIGGGSFLLFGVPTLFYLWLVVDPRTHVYTFFPGAILLASYGLATAATKLNNQQATAVYALGFVGFIWYVASFIYVYLLFADVSLERQRTWTDNQPKGYFVTWDEPPRYGLFGFPYRAGWQVASAWTAENYPNAIYASNEEAEITDWYMAQAPHTHCPNFELFIWAENVQDEVAFDMALLEDWHVQAEVIENGRATLKIYGRQPTPSPIQLPANTTTRWFTPGQIAPPYPAIPHPLRETLGQEVLLLGYGLDSSHAYPGGNIIITLYWQALRPIQYNYQAFVHVHDGTMWGQDDSAPECGFHPTSHWEAGEIITDPHIVHLSHETPVGAMPVWVGMYDLLTLDRLEIPHNPTNTILLDYIFINPNP